MGVDVQVFIDNKFIMNDTIYYNPINYLTKKVTLKLGVHRIKVISNTANITKEVNVFLLPNQYIILEFSSGEQTERGSPDFMIESQFNPFYYE